MNAVSGIGSSSLSVSALDSVSPRRSAAELDANDWFAPTLFTSGQAISASSSSFDMGTSLDQIAQKIVAHICTSQEI